MGPLAGETLGTAAEETSSAINPAYSGRVGQGAPVEVLLSWHCDGLSGQDPRWLLATVSSNWQALSTQENMRRPFCDTA